MYFLKHFEYGTYNTHYKFIVHLGIRMFNPFIIFARGVKRYIFLDKLLL